MTQLHLDTKALAGDRPAIVFSNDAIRGLLLTSFERTTTQFAGHSVPFDGVARVEVRLLGLTIVPATMRVTLSGGGRTVFAAIYPGFQATLALHVAGDAKLEMSQITLDVSRLAATITASAPRLLLGSPDYEVTGAVTASADRQNALAVAGISEDDLLRIEGSMAFVMPRRIVAAVFATIPAIDLAEHFTAFELRGAWELHVVDDGLVLIPEGGIAVRAQTGCPRGDSAPELAVTHGPKGTVDDENYTWPIVVGGVAVAVVRPANTQLSGFAALYAPKPLWVAKFSQTMPGIVYRESDNGFIGYDLTLSAGLSYVDVRVDPARFGLVLDLTVQANGAAFLTVDVPCVGRCDLAYARFDCAPSTVSIFLSFRTAPTGKLVLESQIDALSIGDVTANVSGFSRWLGVAGGKAMVVGFFIDYVLKRIIEHHMPNKLRDAIKSELNAKNFQLFDLETLGGFARYTFFNQVTFSGDADSVLVGLVSNG